MNVENPKTEKVLMILNHVALSLSLGTMFIDTIKMVFVHHKELPYSPSPELWNKKRNEMHTLFNNKKIFNKVIFENPTNDIF